MSTIGSIRGATFVATLMGAAFAHAAAATIDFEGQGLLATQGASSTRVPFVSRGVTFTAVPIPQAPGVEPLLSVVERSRAGSCADPASQDHVLGAGRDANLPIRADFPPGLSVTEVSVEVLACLPPFEGAASLHLYDSQGILLASAGSSFPPASSCSHLLRAVSAQPVAYAIVDVPSNCGQCTGIGRCTQFWVDNFAFETTPGR